MKATCPHCAFDAELDAFFVEAEGKKLAALLADVPAECGRALIAYLRMFKPAKTGLRIARATKIAQEVLALIAQGTVCRDERSGVRRPATPTMWAQGMETMLANRDRLSLPLETHGYLRAVVFGIADNADAAVERQRHADAQAGRHLSAGDSQTTSEPRGESKLQAQLAFIENMVRVGHFTDEQAQDEVAKAHQKFGGQP